MPYQLLFPGFFELIHNFDIFLLYETHVTDSDTTKYKKYFVGYELCWVSAVRSASFGRAKGGCLYGVKKSSIYSKLVKFQYINNSVILSLSTNKVSICIIPTYLNCNNWEADFLNLSECVETLSSENIIILGDLNVRIGEEQEITPELGISNFNLSTLRKSRDKTVNGRGRKFLDLCEDQGLIILNGRTQGDFNGEYTFTNANGSSVNDVVAVSHNLTPCINYLTINNQIYSDHFPVELICTLRHDLNLPNLSKEMRLLPKLQWKCQNSNLYKSKIARAIREMTNETTINELVNVIVNAASKINGSRTPFKKKWFDMACLKSRQKSFKWLTLFRKHNTEFERSRYLAENKNFRDLCKKKKQAYYEEISLKLSMSRDSKEFWSLVKELRGSTFTMGSDINITSFKNYFEKLLNPPMNANAILYAAPYVEDTILDGEIQLGELLEVLKKAKDNKAPGPDRIPYEFFKQAPLEYWKKLIGVFNAIFENENIPDNFSNSIVFPIYKKGDPNLPENYRGLTFMDVIAKLLTGIANNRLVLWEQSHDVLKESQAGFRSGYSTVDNIFNIFSTIKIKLARKGGKVYAFFVDFKAAFDTINRGALFYKLYHLGVSTKFIRFLQGLYRNTRAQVWNGDLLSEKFDTNTGLRQGCLLSPMLFALFINDIDDNMGGGINIDGLVVKSLLYADDLVLLAEEPAELQDMIDKLEAYCQNWNLMLNLDKSKIMVFQRGGGRRTSSENWIYQGENIEVVKKFKYLGITLTPKLSMREHLRERLAAAKGTLNSTWSSFIRNVQVKNSAKFRMYSAVSRSQMCYGAQVWGFSECEEVEKLQRFFIKKLFLLPSKTPNYVLMLETGLPNLYIYTLKCHFAYLLKVLSYYKESRLPYILANKAIESKLYWCEEWLNLAEKHGVQIDSSWQNIEYLSQILGEILEKEEKWLWEKAQDRARQTVRHGLYDKLKYNLGELNYFRDSFSTRKIRAILMYRSGMLSLNASPWRSEGRSICSLCSLEEDEDLLHYLAVCPILKEFRILAFGKTYLTESEVISILNGDNFDALFQYDKLAWKYRQMLIEEFNY